jgi:uncharacterized 2Fe-2S/4Fe-4S cluster protein (DUF4445 family)
VLEETMLPLIARLCDAAGIEGGGIYRAAVAGNTTMTHLFAGVYPDFLRLEPYVPAFFHKEGFRSADLGLGLNPDAEISTECTLLPVHIKGGGNLTVTNLYINNKQQKPL